MRKKHHRRPPVRHGNQIKAVLLIIVMVVALGAAYFFAMFDKRFFPAAIEIASISAQANINKLIDDSIKKITADMGLNSSDFYVKSLDNDGKVNSLSANTLLINEVCAELAVGVSQSLSNAGPEVVGIPIGSLLGIDMFANTGPAYKVKILPRGNATVDYETSFVAAGINQINFQIWLNIESKVQIVNPLQSREMIISRKISLVNTVINGEVPPAYIDSNFRQAVPLPAN